MRTTGMGSLYNLHYHVRLVSPEIEKQFLTRSGAGTATSISFAAKVPQVKEAL